MNIHICKTILAASIAAIISAPAFAADHGMNRGLSESPGKNESGMTMRSQSTTSDSLERQPHMGPKSMGTAERNQLKNNPIYMRSAKSLDGMDVVGVNGEAIGTIKRIVMTKDRRNAHAVISTGGILGFGGRDVMVSLDELNTTDDKLLINLTQKQLKNRQEFQSEQYDELNGDKPIGDAISDISAFYMLDKPSDLTMAPETVESSR